MLFHFERLENNLALFGLKSEWGLESIAPQHCLALIDYEEGFALWFCCSEIVKVAAEPLCLYSPSILNQSIHVWAKMCHRNALGSWAGKENY